jgi:hypothetical protein
MGRASLRRLESASHYRHRIPGPRRISDCLTGRDRSCDPNHQSDPRSKHRVYALSAGGLLASIVRRVLGVGWATKI